MSFSDILWVVLVGTPVVGVLIVVHELGHFLVAKWCGVGVIKFSIGFGPAVLRRRFGETVYQLGLIPLGGFVRMVGDIPDMISGSQATDAAVREGDEKPPVAEEQLECLELYEDRSRWFVEKGLLAKSAIVSAGPVFNFLLPIVLVTLAAFFVGQEDLMPESVVGGVSPGSPAEQSGIREGDRILRVGDNKIESWEQLTEVIHGGTGQPLEILLKRAEEELSVVVVPQKQTLPDLRNGEKVDVYLIGISPSFVTLELGPFSALRFGILWTLDKTALTYLGLWGMVSGVTSPKDLAGPLFIFEAAGREAEKGFVNVVYFMSLLSVSLAVLNLLPIPILDGGHLLFFLIEALIGPISVRSKEYAQQVGMLLLILLMVYAIHNDITRDPIGATGGISWEHGNMAGEVVADAQKADGPAQPAEAVAE